MADNSPTGLVPWLQRNIYDPAKQALTHFSPPAQPVQDINHFLGQPPQQAIGQALEGAGKAVSNVPSEIASLGKDIGSSAVGKAVYNPHPSQPAPATHAPAAALNPDALTWQAIASKYLQPLINSVGSSPSQINSALAPYSSGVPASIGQSISQTLQSSISDYRGGLSSMLQTLPEQGTQAALLAGLKNVIQYPVAGLTGTQGAPPSVQDSQTLMNLYQTLNAERSGGNPVAASQFFGQSPTSSANPYTDPNAVNSLLAGK